MPNVGLNTVGRIGKVLAESMHIEDEITAATKFDDLDLDSLDVFQVIIDVEDEFDIELPDTLFNTVGELAEYIDANKVRCYR